jgi:hypothetical protein
MVRPNFVREESIRGLQRQLEEETNLPRRLLLRKLLAEEKAKLLALSKRRPSSDADDQAEELD